MTKLPEQTLIDLLTDPVMAAEVLMGWELDSFQGARLKTDWWFPETIDDSGVSTGKTLTIFILACLRALLIPGTTSAPGHWVGVYFQNFQVAKDEFWPYFEQTLAKSDFFASQCKRDHGKLGEHKLPGAWRWEFKNGSRIIVPAPGHATDGENHASRRFNTLIVDEWAKCEEKGDAIAKQLLGRVTRESFSQHHPIWGNHIHFKGHAQSPTHKSGWRVRTFKRLIREGSTRHAIYSYSYRDVSNGRTKEGRPWKKVLISYQTIMTMRAQFMPDERLRQLLGVRVRGGTSYYPDSILHHARTPLLYPVVKRAAPEWHYFLGFDVAPGQSLKADYSSAYIMGAREADGKIVKPSWKDDKFGAWQIASFYAYTLKNKSSGETAAFIHWLHWLFQFSGICMDPGGGGLWVYKDLKKAKHIIDGVEKTFIPLCSPDETLTADKQPILHFFKRGDAFDRLSFVHNNHLVSDDGFLCAAHQRFQSAWQAREILVPLAYEDRSPEEVRLWTPDMVEVQKTIDIGITQLTKVRQVTDDDGKPKLSKRGFPLITAQGKKDIAYSQLYAFMETVRWIESHFGGAPTGEAADYFSFN